MIGVYEQSNYTDPWVEFVYDDNGFRMAKHTYGNVTDWHFSPPLPLASPLWGDKCQVEHVFQKIKEVICDLPPFFIH